MNYCCHSVVVPLGGGGSCAPIASHPLADCECAVSTDVVLLNAQSALM